MRCNNKKNDALHELRDSFLRGFMDADMDIYRDMDILSHSCFACSHVCNHPHLNTFHVWCEQHVPCRSACLLCSAFCGVRLRAFQPVRCDDGLRWRAPPRPGPRGVGYVCMSRNSTVAPSSSTATTLYKWNVGDLKVSPFRICLTADRHKGGF